MICRNCTHPSAASTQKGDADVRSGPDARGARALGERGKRLRVPGKVQGEMNKRMFALGRLKVGAMNKTESAYAVHLEALKQAGHVLWFKFEGIKLRLADNTFYTPDFAVMAADGVIELHEVKGFWQDDARAKIKIASDMYPFRFMAFKVQSKKNGGGWDSESFE